MPDHALLDLPNRFFGGQDRLKGPLPPELCAPGYSAEIVGFPRMNAHQHSEFGRGFYAGFPDLQHTIDESFACGDKVAVRFTLRGTHRGNFLGLPASGRQIEVSAFVFLTVIDGKVSHMQAMFDQLWLQRQIGALPL